MSEKKEKNGWKYIGIMGIGAISFNTFQEEINLWVSFFLIAFTIMSFVLYFREN